MEFIVGGGGVHLLLQVVQLLPQLYLRIVQVREPVVRMHRLQHPLHSPQLVDLIRSLLISAKFRRKSFLLHTRSVVPPILSPYVVQLLQIGGV